jgi:hypothetical protein
MKLFCLLNYACSRLEDPNASFDEFGGAAAVHRESEEALTGFMRPMRVLLWRY